MTILNSLENSLILVFACFSISAAAFCFFSEVAETYKSKKLWRVLQSAVASSLGVAILGPWSYFMMVKSLVSDVKAKSTSLSFLLSATLFSFVPLGVMTAVTERALVAYHFIAVVAISILGLIVLLKQNDL